MDVALYGFDELKDKIKAPNDTKLEFLTATRYNEPGCRKIFDFDIWIERIQAPCNQDDFEAFFKAGGLMISFLELMDEIYKFEYIKFLEEKNLQAALSAWSRMLYAPYHFTLNASGGKVISPTRKAGILSSIIRKMECYSYYFTKYPSNSLVLAVNRAGYAVALKIPILEGEAVILPGKHPSASIEYYLPILQSLMEILPQLKKPSEKEMYPPEWVSRYTFPEEEELLKKREEIDQQLAAFTLRKELLYAYGDRLEKAVRFPLEKFGFVVERLPEEESADFILKVNDKEVAAVEVTGSTKHINVDKVRQLLDFIWNFVRERSEIKGILVANHFYEKPPEERGEPFTSDALKTAQNNDVCLVTTIELFNVLQKLEEGKVKPEEIRDKLLNTVGIYIF
ncbi:MAG: hypothetical protein QXS54_01110 [Candidatus Methanomethylicaceae archaeon]